LRLVHPFNRRPPMSRSSWDRLKPKQLHERACRVMQYARDTADPGSFHTAEAVDDLLGGADPEEAEAALAEARKRIAARSETLDDAVRRLSSRYRGRTVMSQSDGGQKLEALFRQCLSRGQSLASAAAGLNEDETMQYGMGSALGSVAGGALGGALGGSVGEG